MPPDNKSITYILIILTMLFNLGVLRNNKKKCITSIITYLSYKITYFSTACQILMVCEKHGELIFPLFV